MSKTRLIGLVAAVVVTALPWVVTLPGLSPAGHRMLSIFLAAIALWVTEAIPLYATATLIILLEVLWISDQALLAPPAGFAAPKYQAFFATLADPVLILFLGGFFLAHGAARFDLDRNLARVMLRPFGQRASMILGGLILITALLSMFMSNTATTATMMAVVLPVMGRLPPGDRMRAGLALCIPVAANLGGLGTPIGTPSNAIAIGALGRGGVRIEFVQWMFMVLPFMMGLLVVAWLLLAWMFRFSGRTIAVNIDAKFDRSRRAVIFYAVFATTVLLWLTSELHGMNSNVVGFVPVVLLLVTGVFGARDIQSLQWHVLWLVAGGIALGMGVEACGLDRWLLGLVDWAAMPPVVIVAALSMITLIFSTVMSNSATANLMVPLAISLASAGSVQVSPVMAAVYVALASSLAMALPISTPPNALAISTDAVTTKDMARVGVIVGLIGWGVLLVFGRAWWHLLGIVP